MHLFVRLALAALCLSFSAGAATNMIVEIVPFVVVDGAFGSEQLYGHAIDGDTGYFQLTFGSGTQITRVEALSSSQTFTRLVTPAEWLLASSNVSMNTFYGLSLHSNYLQFSDVFSDAIWRVDRNDGTLTEYVSKPVISNYTGRSGAQCLTPSITDPRSGEHVFFEAQSDQILVTTGPGSVTTLVSQADLESTFGNDTVTGCFAYDDDHNLYWGNTVIDSVCSLTSNGALIIVFDESKITQIIGGTSLTFGDFLFGPDGLVYFCAGAGGGAFNILRFDPRDPGNTLEMHIPTEEIAGSVAGGSIVVTLSWYNGAITWHQFGRNGVYAGYRNLTYHALSATGEVALTEFSSNVAYTCEMVFTNGTGSVVTLDATTNATWQLVGDVPPNTSLDGNLLTVGEATNLPVTIEATYFFDDTIHTNRVEVWVIPEPALALAALAGGLVCARRYYA